MEKLPLTQPVTLRGTIDEICKTASETGYDAVELHIREPARYNTEEILRTIKDFGLNCCAVANGMEYTVGGLSLIDDNKEIREAALNRILEHADFAASLDAALIVGLMRGNIPRGGDVEKYLDRFTEALHRICDYSQKLKIKVVLESIMRYISNYLCGVPETMDYISSLNRNELSLHIDTHSMAVEEKNLGESILYCRNKALGYVHYAENNRMYPGGGALDFKEITKALMDIGYKGYITVECLPSPSAVESAKRAFDYIKSIEKIIKIESHKIEKQI